MLGINSQIVTNSGSFSGLSFAIPVSTVKSVASQLIKNGYVTRGWLGLAFQNLTQELAESFNLESSRGALVAKVMPNSPAYKAGIQSGDIIIQFNNEDVLSAADLPPKVGLIEINTTVRLKVIRNNNVISLNLCVESVPNTRSQILTYHANENTTEFGIEVKDIDNIGKNDFINLNGVMVCNVESSIWIKSGVRKGDIIMSINQQPILNAKNFYQELKKVPKAKSVPILIMRSGEMQRYITLKFEDN